MKLADIGKIHAEIGKNHGEIGELFADVAKDLASVAIVDAGVPTIFGSSDDAILMLTIKYCYHLDLRHQTVTQMRLTTDS